jgi:hypothetical protein
VKRASIGPAVPTPAWRGFLVQERDELAPSHVGQATAIVREQGGDRGPWMSYMARAQAASSALSTFCVDRQPDRRN